MDLAHISFTGTDPALPRVHTLTRQRKHARNPGRRPLTASPAETLDPFVGSILRQLGVNPAIYRTQPLQRRLSACLRHLRVPSVQAAEALLQRRPHLLPSALDTLLIGVSELFRDPAVFDRLRTTVLPELLQQRPGINVYAAGVSSGHELYSLAILLDELGALDQSTLLGIDCRPAAIASAINGVFSQEELAVLDPPIREKYFTIDRGQRRAAARLRSRIEWRCADLMEHAPPAVQDLILCRNVVIYLEHEAAFRVWTSLCHQLAPGGFLVTGKAEQPPPTLPLRRVAHCIYRRS